MKTISIQNSANPFWLDYHEHQCMTLCKKPFFSEGDSVFTIGSCFAEEIRAALEEKKVPLVPKYEQIPLDSSQYRIDKLPYRYHMSFYSTFSILQEFERCVGKWTQSPDDHWEIEDSWWGGTKAYQDPYRRAVFAKTKDTLRTATSHINKVMADGFQSADVIFITMGLIEVWKKNDNGFVACQTPGYLNGGGKDDTTFHLSTYEENYENMKSMMDLIFKHKPTCKVVLTVSPVPLARTFTDNDVFVANAESKAVLLAVTAKICREYESVKYFPAYEIVSAIGEIAFIERDGRHVKPKVVNWIIDTFMKANAGS